MPRSTTFPEPVHRSDSPSLRDDAPVTASKIAHPRRTLVGEAVTIAKPASELYSAWRKPERLAGILENVVSIERLDGDRSRWTIKAPAGEEVSWISAITHDVPGEEISWQSEEGGDVGHSGRISFTEAGSRGTIVRAVIAYDPPGGKLGKLIAKLFQREPAIQTRRDLHRFKQFMETGELATGARNAREQAEREEEQAK